MYLQGRIYRLINVLGIW